MSISDGMRHRLEVRKPISPQRGPWRPSEDRGRTTSGDGVRTLWMQALVIGQVVLEGCAARHRRAGSSPAPGYFDRSVQTLVSRTDMMAGGGPSRLTAARGPHLPRLAPHGIGKSALRPALEALDERRHRLAGSVPSNTPHALLRPGPYGCTSALLAPISATHWQSRASPWTGRKVRLECAERLPRNGPWASVYAALAGRASSGQDQGHRQVLICVPARSG